ncbi:MAG: hypothetical protein HZA24_11950 [Nitrospirae bacterium]|nr:hypothetical protein [Nitrospirota bacterium]
MADARSEPFARAVNEHLGKVATGLAALDLAAAHARIDAAAGHGMGDIHAATRAASAAEAAFDDARHLRDLNRNTVTGLDQVHGYQDAVADEAADTLSDITHMGYVRAVAWCAHSVRRGSARSCRPQVKRKKRKARGWGSG